MSNLTIVIPTLANEKTLPYLELCLESLERYSPEHEVVIAFNGGTYIPKKLQRYIVRITKEPGQCKAVNQAMSLVTTDYVMVSNDDMVFSPGWDSFMMDVDVHRCVSPNLVEAGGGAEPFLDLDMGKDPTTFDWRKWEEFVAKSVEGVVEDGFNLPFLTETAVFNAIDGYDEVYDPYGSNSDPDVMYKMMIVGIRPTRVRSSLVYHFSNQSSDPSQSEEAKKSWWTNWRYFPRKWGFERDGRGNIWYAGGEKGTRIPTEERPYVAEIAHGHGIHPGKDWLEYKPEWMGKYGEPFYGDGDYYEQ